MDKVTELIARFKDTDKSVRRNAAESLGEIGSLAVPALIEALKDRNWRVRWNAALALGQIEDTRAVLALIVAIKDEDIRVRRKAVRLLGEIASREPIPELRAALPILRRMRIFHSSYREALDKIEAATSNMKELPLPAAAPLPDATSLPLPSTVPATSPDDLPIPSALPADNTSDILDQVPMSNSRRWWLRREKRH